MRPTKRMPKRMERAPVEAQGVQERYGRSLMKPRPPDNHASPADNNCAVLDPDHSRPPAFTRAALSTASQCASSSRATVGAIVRGKRCPPSGSVSRTGAGSIAFQLIASTIDDIIDGGVARSSAAEMHSVPGCAVTLEKS